jgi:hypothetical protein
MSDTYGPMYETPLARWDRQTSSWRTCAATSLWDLPMSSPTLPTWGCLRDGELYELPTPERVTVEHGYSWLPTPTVIDSKGPIALQRNQMDKLRDITWLLPTPAVNDMGAGKDPQAWDEWAARQKAADGRPAPHGKSLEQEALRVGVNTHQRLTAGGASWADLLQPLPFAEPIGTA